MRIVLALQRFGFDPENSRPLIRPGAPTYASPACGYGIEVTFLQHEVRRRSLIKLTIRGNAGRLRGADTAGIVVMFDDANDADD